MQNNDNQKTYFIYVRSTGEKVPVTKEQHDSWLVFSIVFLISSIQSFFNDRKREKREEESAARDLKYHEDRMQREKEQAEHEREYHEKRMKSLE